MKNFLLLIITLAISTACHLNIDTTIEDVKTAQRPIVTAPFEQICNTTPYKVLYEQGESCNILIKGEEKAVLSIEAKSDGKKLVITSKGSTNITHGLKELLAMAIDEDNYDKIQTTIHITSPDLIGVEVKGSGEFESREIVDSDNLGIHLEGSGDITFKDIICDNATITCLGSGDIDIKKLTSVNTRAELKGSGDIEINETNVTNTQVKVLGSGDIDITGTSCGSILAEVLGSGDIEIKGSFSSIDERITGSGSINTP